jgi:hypothetical protein
MEEFSGSQNRSIFVQAPQEQLAAQHPRRLLDLMHM